MVKRHRDPGTGHCGGEAFGVLPSGPGLVKSTRHSCLGWAEISHALLFIRCAHQTAHLEVMWVVKQGVAGGQALEGAQSQPAHWQKRWADSSGRRRLLKALGQPFSSENQLQHQGEQRGLKAPVCNRSIPHLLS